MLNNLLQQSMNADREMRSYVANVTAWLKENNIKYEQIFDEIVIEVPKGKEKEVSAALAKFAGFLS